MDNTYLFKVDKVVFKYITGNPKSQSYRRVGLGTSEG
jgi:hypothetical protein